LRGEKILIATGSSPVHPDLFPFGHSEIYDSDTILELDRIPKILAVVGAGVIGAEYGCTFRALGAEVHIIDGRDILLPFLDAEVSQALMGAFQRCGIVFHWKENVQNCIPLESGGVRLELSSGAALSGDAVLVAAGRQSNTGKLRLEKVGVKTGERGIIPVNDHRRPGWHSEAALSSGRSEADRRAYHGRPRDGGRAHRSGGDDVQRLSESLCRRLLKSADSGNALQNRDA
jgi:NAD(P) transhydrogenase